MGQRHQLFVIARLKGRYRRVASFHSQWLSGTSVPSAACRLIRAFINPFNAAAIASELSTVTETDFEAFARQDNDGDYENPAVLCPYLTGLFVTCCRVDMEKGFLYRLSLEPISVLPSQCDNDDGFTCFDLTEPGKPRYCFWWPDGGPVKAVEYLRGQDGEENEADDEREYSAMFELLDRSTLLDVSTLADAWPEDFGPLLQHTQPPDVEQVGATQSDARLPSLSALSAVAAIREILASPDDVDSESTVSALASVVAQKSHLELLRAELLAAGTLNANGVRLLKLLLAAEKAKFVDLKPWVSSGAVDAAALDEFSDALQHAESIDLSSSSTLTADILQSHVHQWPNIKHVIAFSCPLLGPLTTTLPLTSYLASALLLPAVEQTRLRGPGISSVPECIRWAHKSDAPAALSVVLFCPPLSSYARSTAPKRFGVELAHFGAEGVVRGFTRFLERLYNPKGWFDESGFYYEMRAYFHITGAVAVADFVADPPADAPPSYAFGCLPSLIRDGRVKSANEADGSESEADESESEVASAVGMAGVPRHPGWVLVLDTKGTMPEHQRTRDKTPAPRPEYAFERWDVLPGRDTAVLRPVERISVREWADRLHVGHGVVPEAVLADCEAVLARLNVALRDSPGSH